jgi:hypothetical protein
MIIAVLPPVISLTILDGSEEIKVGELWSIGAVQFGKDQRQLRH